MPFRIRIRATDKIERNGKDLSAKVVFAHLHPIPLKKHGRRAKSLFRLGFDHLRHLILNLN
jgi:hypothetical protein